MQLNKLVNIDNRHEYFNIKNENINTKINKIKLILHELSSVSEFSDNKWIFNLRKKVKNMSIDTYTAYFTNIPTQYLEIVKLHTLLIGLRSTSRALDFPVKILHLFNFYGKNSISISKVSINNFQLFENYLFEIKKIDGTEYNPKTLFQIWDAAKFLHSTLDWYPFHSYLIELHNRLSPISMSENENNRKPIDNQILYELDEAFNKNNIPLHVKTAYWMARLFPLRINEVLNLSINCYKHVNKDFVLILFPDIKTNGGYSALAYRSELLYLRDNHQFHLFKLIQKQKEVAELLQNNIEEKDLLFTFNAYGNVTRLFTRDYFRIYFIKIQKSIKLETHYTVHQLRTTGATLRAEHGFTSMQLKELLNVNLNTVSTYSKIDNKKLVDLQNKILKNDNNPKAFFKGKIINSSNSYIEQQIIKNPLAYKLPDLGYCTYENKCGKHFDCLECEYLLPDVNLLEFYRLTALKQLEKSEFWIQKGNNIYTKDNLHRATLFTKLYEKSLIVKRELNDAK